MNIIVAVDKNWSIGKENKLLFSIPEDMKFFKEKTTGKTVIMGSKTLKSLPHSRPLPNRKNIIISKNKELEIDGAFIANDIDSLQKLIDDVPPDNVFVIGGEQIYSLLLKYCDNAYITKINSDGHGDKFFPDLDKMPDWKLTEKSEVKNHNGIEFTFTKYTHIK